ncbi:uncharacterized protein LOC144227000 isoform X2 [Crocuta crocuta]
MRLWELVTSACSGLSRNLCEGEPKVKLVFRFFRDFTDSLWLPDSSVSNRASLRLHCSGADPTSGNRPPQSHKPRRAPCAPVSCCPHRKIHSHNLSQPFICLWRLGEANWSIDHLTTVLPFRAQKRGGRRRPQERMGREALGIVPRTTGESSETNSNFVSVLAVAKRPHHGVKGHPVPSVHPFRDVLLCGCSVTFPPFGTFAQDICFQVIRNQSAESDVRN